MLLDLAGAAALEGTRSIALSDEQVDEIADATGSRSSKARAPHLELGVRLHAPSARALDQGRFRLQVTAVSRSAGSMTGRFWHLFPAAEAPYANLPTVDPDAELAQLSFHAGRSSADLLTRAPCALPRLVSVGEFRHREPGVLFPDDLGVGVADGRPYLVELSTSQRLELLAPTALNFVWNNYTPPLARFLAEISRACCPQVTWFDWGAAWTLPFTPAVQFRRSVLAPARWRVRARDLPARSASLHQWADQFRAWSERVGVPRQVVLVEDDQHLPLDLEQDMHIDLLRRSLDTSPIAAITLHEAPPPHADGWIGGRAHDLVIPLKARP